MKKIPAKVVLLLLLLESLFTRVEGFSCYKDECRPGSQYCVPERERCYLCKDRIDECGTTSIPKDCIVHCEHVKLNGRVSDLNQTVAEQNNVNGERMRVINQLKEQLSGANATIGETVIRLNEEKEKLDRSHQQQEDCLKSKTELTICLVVAGAVVALVTGLGVFMVMLMRERRLHCQSKPTDDVERDESRKENAALLNKGRSALGQQNDRDEMAASSEEVTALLNNGGSDSAISSSCSVDTNNERIAEETVSNNEVRRPTSGPGISSVRPEADAYSHRDSQTTRDGTTAGDKGFDARGTMKEEGQFQNLNAIPPTDGTSNSKSNLCTTVSIL